MKKNIAKIILVFGFLFSASFVGADEMPTLNLHLNDDFGSALQCAWKSPLKIWVGMIEDARASKEVGTMINKDQETPVYSDQPVTAVVRTALQAGVKKCGFTEVTEKESADILLTGQIETLSGTSKKGIFKGESKGEIDVTVNLQRPARHDDFSISFAVEESKKKGITKNPKKLEEMLNRLLTRLTVDVLESRKIANWMKSNQ